MAGDNDRSRLFTRRAILIGGAQAGLFSILAGRLYYLSVIEGEKYRTLAEDNRINLRLLAPTRGLILDRTGAQLALNQQNYRLVLLPEQIKNLDLLLDKLGGYVEITEPERRRITREVRSASTFNAIPVKDNLTWDQVARLSLYTLDLPGTDVDTGEVRSYPYGAATSHVLGYIGIVSEKDLGKEEDGEESTLAIPGFRIGKNGVEKQYDPLLRGTAGNVEMEVNARGRVVRELARKDSEPGRELRLTLDIGLQQFAQQRLAREQGAAAVVMDAQNGDVLALISQPGFDPNLFTYGISQTDWDRLNKDENAPLLNKAIAGLYAPGSTIKPVVAMAALEADMLNPEAKTFCPGHFDLGNHRFHCWKRGGHGHVNLTQAVAGSCDVYFYDLGKRIGIDRIQAMAKRFGLGQKLGLDLPHERAGLVPGRAWKSATQGSNWQQGETLVAAIGQGYMLATPLQLAVMAARIGNGGKAVVPHIVRPVKPEGTPENDATSWPSLGFKPDHVALLQKTMNAVVNETFGTAYSVRIDKPSMAMAGKTGTSQVRRISQA
ncbi:MAG: penicillin-binding protein 2 [Alphaproteobacteria bacterium]|nr:penicillin-binding protein 2 [Alphaproteobacteria bacterium]